MSHFSFIPMLLLYALIQTLLFIRSWIFVRKVFPNKWKTAAFVILSVFFLWVNSSAVYYFIFGIFRAHYHSWQLYGFIYPFFGWITASFFIFIIYIIKDLIVLLWKGFKKLLTIAAKLMPAHDSLRYDPSSEKIDHGRRNFLRIASAGLAVPPLGITTYTLIFSSRELFVNEFELNFPQLQENLRGIKIAQFSDIHCSPYTTKSDIDAAVRIINDSNPDIVLLTGDYVPMELDFIYPCVESIRNLKGKFGVFASLGNHEEWTNAGLITKVLMQNNISVLRNAGITMDINGEKLNLLGVDDSRWGRADLQRAENMVKPGPFTLLMSHQPPFWDTASVHGVDLTLAGHTHGGQIALDLAGEKFSFGQIVHKYNEGLFTKGNSKLFVNTGFGYTGPPIRYNVPPEIAIITLT